MLPASPSLQNHHLNGRMVSSCIVNADLFACRNTTRAPPPFQIVTQQTASDRGTRQWGATLAKVREKLSQLTELCYALLSSRSSPEDDPLWEMRHFAHSSPSQPYIPATLTGSTAKSKGVVLYLAPRAYPLYSFWRTPLACTNARANARHRRLKKRSLSETRSERKAPFPIYSPRNAHSALSSNAEQPHLDS